MGKLFFGLGISLLMTAGAFAQDEKVAPFEAEMGGQVYLCGLKAQLADATKGPKQKALLEDVKQCADKSRERIKLLVKSEYQKYPEGDAAREKIKAVYSAYLTYMSAALWGKDLTESTEALAFKEKVSDYKAEVEIR